MANTYTQLSIHAVFAVKYRENIITKEWRASLHKYISGIIQNTGAKPFAVGGWLDHVHIFCSLPPTLSTTELLRIVKTNSSKYINESGFTKRNFEWQKGYGAFSYARSQRDKVIKYIINQELHHSTQSFKQEYFEMLKKHEVEFEEKYVFEFYE
jgi:putative transposase